jgi:hypothetical protein
MTRDLAPWVGIVVTLVLGAIAIARVWGATQERQRAQDEKLKELVPRAALEDLERRHAILATGTRDGERDTKAELAALREQLFAAQRTLAILDDRWGQMDKRLVRIETAVERIADRLGGAKG